MKNVGMKKQSRWLMALGLLLLVAANAMAARVSSLDPMGRVESVLNEIISILEDKALAGPESVDKRRNLVIEKVEGLFDFEEIAMRAMGRHWRERTPAEKTRFVNLFKQLLEKTYIDRIDTYSGERAVFQKQDIRGDYAMVYTQFVTSKNEIPINYKLRKKTNGWMVYDVEIETVSLVLNYRNQFDSIINREKYAGLVQRMEEKIAKGEPLDGAP